jgi:hypothetical protein
MADGPAVGARLRCLYDYAGDTSVGTPPLIKNEELTLLQTVRLSPTHLTFSSLSLVRCDVIFLLLFLSSCGGSS